MSSRRDSFRASSPGTLGLFLAAGLTVCAVFANTLWNDWTYDDPYVAGANPFVQDWRNWPRVFSADYFTLAREGSWRPAVTTSYFLDASVWGANPYGFHLTNLLLHLAVALLLLGRLRRIGLGNAAALAGTLAFAAHPAACEAVDGVGFREDLLAALFGLAAWTALGDMASARGMRRWALGACGGVCVLLAQLSKENALAWPLLFLAWRFLGIFPGRKELDAGARGAARSRGWDRGSGEPRHVAPLMTAWIAAGAGLALQFGVFVFRAPMDKSWIYGSSWSSWMGAPRLFARYLGLTVFPMRLSAEYPWPAALVSPWIHTAAGLALGALLIWFTFLLWRKAPRAAGAWLLFAIPLAPVCGAAPMAQPFAERFLYMPLLGAGWLAAEIAEWVFSHAMSARRARWALRLAAALIAAILAALAGRTVSRNFDWRDNVSLFAPVGESNPQSARGLTALGLRLAREKRYAEAELRFRQSLALNEESPANWGHLANALGAQGKSEDAAKAADRATELWPEYAPAHLNAAIYWMRVDPPQARRARAHLEALRALGETPPEELAEEVEKGLENEE